MIRISISQNTQILVLSVTRPEQVPSWDAGFGMRLYRLQRGYSEMLWHSRNRNWFNYNTFYGILTPIDLHPLENIENEDLKNSIANSEK